MPSSPHPLRRRFMAGLLALTLVGVAGAGAYWHQTAPMKEVAIVGNVHAPTEQLLELAALENDSLRVMLYQVDVDAVADSVRRHPWVRAANATRLPTGTLRISVDERQPVALALDVFGEPMAYLDRDGFVMPVMEGEVDAVFYDVPLVRGPSSVFNAPRIERAETRALLAALAETDPMVDALLSEIVIDATGEATIRTTPAGGHESLRVLIGRAASKETYLTRLQSLRAFYDQAVLTRPERTYELIDLRYEGQVVTREQ